MSLEPEQHFPAYLRPQMSAVQNPKRSEDYQSFADYQEKLVKNDSGPQKLNLSHADTALIKKINQEYFFTRSVPMALLAGGAVLFASQRGFITTGIKLKTFFAGSVGYISSKASLVKTINDRFLEELPDSDVSNFIRQKRGLPLRVKPLIPESTNSKFENVSANTTAQQEDFSYFESPESAEKSVEKSPSMTYDFLRFQNRMKYNHTTKTSMPDVSAQNDTKSEPEDYTSSRDENPHGDDHIQFESREESEQKQPKMTYDMLRAQNRMKYPEMIRKPEEKEIISKAPPPMKSSNRYGDEQVE